MLVSDFAARLEAFGFSGDALSVASRLARKDGGTMISVDAVYGTLRGGQKKLAFKHTTPLTVALGATPRERAPLELLRPQFENRVYVFSEQNDEKCGAMRKCFSEAPRDHKFVAPPRKPISSASRPLIRPSPVPMRPTGARSMTQLKQKLRSPLKDRGPKPAWNDTVDVVSDSNVQLSSNLRQFFSNPTDKPVMEEIKRKLQERGNKRAVLPPNSPQPELSPSPADSGGAPVPDFMKSSSARTSTRKARKGGQGGERDNDEAAPHFGKEGSPENLFGDLAAFLPDM